MALDQITVEYNAKIDAMQAQLTELTASMGKIDQKATASGKALKEAFNTPVGILQHLNDQLKRFEERRLKAFRPAAIQEFNQKIEETKAKIRALTGQVEQSGNNMVGTFKQIAGAVGIAFGVQQILRFGKELINLALDAEEVKTAFKNLNNPTILNDLRKAVSGTIDDVTLMKQALKAENLGIPVKNLALAFEFAERRAGALGLSTQEVIDAIVQGIGSKSTRAFTALGIDALRVQDALKGMNAETASIADISEAMSAIFQEELGQMGEAVDSNSDKVERLRAGWTNFKVTIGEGLVNALVGAVDANVMLADAVTVSRFQVDKATLVTKGWTAALGEVIGHLSDAGIAAFYAAGGARDLIVALGGAGAGVGRTQEQVESISSLSGRLAELNTQIGQTTNINTRSRLIAEAKVLSDQLTLATGGETEAMKANRAEMEKSNAERERQAEAFEKFNTMIVNAKKSIARSSQFDPFFVAGENAAEAAAQTTEDLEKEEERRRELQRQSAQEYEDAMDKRLVLIDQTKQAELDLSNAQLNAAQSAVAGIRSLAEQNSETYIALLVLEKLIAIAQVKLNEQAALAVITANIAAITPLLPPLGIPNPAYPAAIALGAAQAALVKGQAAISIGTILATLIPELAFAEGGVDIRGPGTTKSDSIRARISNRESVINAEGTAIDPDLLRAMNKGEHEFEKHIQLHYVWPYMEQIIKAHSKPERGVGMNFNDRNILKRLDTANKLQIKTTQALIQALNKKESRRRYWK